ncbi:MAG TPA: thio(seleno)oxazole modification radical SAM maturase SbtM [Verrucomicrobiae bacterium]
MRGVLRDRWLFGRKTSSFTLQWHLTNRCPFHCRHCYDRSARKELNLAEALAVLADLQAFCRRHRILPRLSLSGGDPLYYPHFWELYQAVAGAGIEVSLLGNPIAENAIRHLLTVHPPAYYQVSLEGLREHNDSIRGRGHYGLTLEFLRTARRLGLETHVMLTLTRANLEQVIPLGTELRGLTSRLTFNRLSQTGEGADLELPDKANYAGFLERYLTARRSNPIFGIKDNLFNIIPRRQGRPLWPGCTGHGCGAAFNFVALLPDGEVHACRKFPSLLGNIRNSDLQTIYHSPLARRYRAGPLGCQDCALRHHCGGCPAVTAGHGLHPLEDRDPHCFF